MSARPATGGGSPAVGATKRIILVVEDDPILRRVAQRILEKGGYIVHVEGGASGALDFLARHHETVRLMLTDLMMPGMSGIELTREVRRSYRSVRLLLTSGHSAESLAAEVEQDPDLPTISKPCTVNELLDLVHTLLDQVD